MCQILSLFKIEFRNNKINFVDKDRRRKTEEPLPERSAELTPKSVKRVEGSISKSEDPSAAKSVSGTK